MPEDGVLPLYLVQSNLSLLTLIHLQKAFLPSSKSQFPLCTRTEKRKDHVEYIYFQTKFKFIINLFCRKIRNRNE